MGGTTGAPPQNRDSYAGQGQLDCSHRPCLWFDGRYAKPRRFCEGRCARCRSLLRLKKKTQDYKHRGRRFAQRDADQPLAANGCEKRELVSLFEFTCEILDECSRSEEHTSELQ